MSRSLFAVAMLACAGAPIVRAQDVLAVAPAHYKLLTENEHVRVVQNTLRPGEKDTMHTHPSGWYYVTQGGSMKVVWADGRTELWTPKTGEAAWNKAEGPHTSQNVGAEPMSYILVEVKSAAVGQASRSAPRR